MNKIEELLLVHKAVQKEMGEVKSGRVKMRRLEDVINELEDA